MARAKYYVVWKGRQTGVFASWEACEAQVNGYPGAEYRAFESREMAEAAFRGQYADYEGKPAMFQQWLFAPTRPILPSLCVDAACSGSPGPLEYRGVRTETGEEVFRQGPFAGGTNNIGEFLAIIHALAWLQKTGLEMPVYTDSETALAWVRAEKCKTDLLHTAENAALFELIARAEAWLAENDHKTLKVSETFRVLKWDTEAWGEIPADFGRK